MITDFIKRFFGSDDESEEEDDSVSESQGTVGQSVPPTKQNPAGRQPSRQPKIPQRQAQPRPVPGHPFSQPLRNHPTAMNRLPENPPLMNRPPMNRPDGPIYAKPDPFGRGAFGPRYPQHGIVPQMQQVDEWGIPLQRRRMQGQGAFRAIGHPPQPRPQRSAGYPNVQRRPIRRNQGPF